MDEDEPRSALAKSDSAMAEFRRLDADLMQLMDATTRAVCDTRRELEGFLAQRYLDRRLRSLFLTANKTVVHYGLTWEISDRIPPPGSLKNVSHSSVPSGCL